MKRRRVKITGIGPVTPAGIGRNNFERGILEEVSRIRPFTKLDPALGSFVAGYIDQFQLEDYGPISGGVPKGSARHTMFAVAGALLALRDAGLQSAELDKRNCVVVAGSSLMDFEGIGRTVEGVFVKGTRGAMARTVFTTNVACISATVAQALAINARTMTIQSSCCTGLDAIGYAARLIATGEAEIAICGGTEAPLYRSPLVELRATGLTPMTSENSDRINRPFDLWRTTGVVSEGACMFVLEPETSPRLGYGFITGYAFANDLSEDLCRGLEFAIRGALADASIRPKQVTAINAWGPGHRQIDAAEARVLRSVFGQDLEHVPCVSIKGAIGNPLGAAPAIQVAAAALGLQRGIIAPTVNWQFPDPDCLLNLSARRRSVPHDVALINAHGLSGVNASMIIQRC